MTLHLEDKWIWDFWFAQDGKDYHIFYLQAPRALQNPELRHWNTSIGHAVSQDLVNWTVLPDVLHPSTDPDAWDSLTTWTGSILHHEGSWFMFYTGTSRQEDGKVQRIGLATSQDLFNWSKHPASPIIPIDPKWYEVFDQNLWYEESWRDPWIFELDGKFHALITARADYGKARGRGLIGHACSEDLMHWSVAAPLTASGDFAYMEVPQLINIGTKWYLLFCVNQGNYSEKRIGAKQGQSISGTYYLMGDHPLGPFTLPDQDLLLGDEEGSAYSGKMIRDPSGQWVLLVTLQNHPTRCFLGDLSDPIPVTVQSNGELKVFKPEGLGN
jgi:beta-fructofuranosidase